jgi:putative transposase
MGVDRAHRLWRTSRLQVPRKRPRRRIALNRPRPPPPTGPYHVWAYDFVFDSCADGKQLKCLTIVDEWTRECLAIDVAGSIRSSRVIDVLARLVSIHGAPAFMRSDNGIPCTGPRSRRTGFRDADLRIPCTSPRSRRGRCRDADSQA